MNTARQLDMQINEWLAQKEQARILSLANAIEATADIHLALLERLRDIERPRDIDPDDLAMVTQGRVTCPLEHRAALRALIAVPTPLEPGMVVPWRLTGDLADHLRRVQRTPWRPAPAPVPLAAAMLLSFLASVAPHVHTSGWRWHIVQTNALQALASASAAQLMRVVLDSPRLGLVFAPPDAQEQDCARRITETERGMQRLCDARVQTHALLTRVMR